MPRVSGILWVDMDVFDGMKPVTQIGPVNTKMSAARNRVHVTNITAHPVTVIVEVMLPSGPQRMEFPNSPLGAGAWADIVNRVPARNAPPQILECDIRRNGGPNGNREPIQCDEIWVKTGAHPWNKLTVNLPFRIAIDAI